MISQLIKTNHIKNITLSIRMVLSRFLPSLPAKQIQNTTFLILPAPSQAGGNPRLRSYGVLKTMPILIAISLLFCSCSEKKESGKGSNVLLITIETLRTDQIGCYGGANNLTPNLDAFAAQGVLFEGMITPVPRTNPSLASLLTGLYPPHHGVRNMNVPLSEDITVLPGILSDSGYKTGAVISHPSLYIKLGFNNGFDHYDCEWDAHKVAEDTTDTALSWIKSNKEELFFMWIHYFDPHWFYCPPAEFEEKYATPFDGTWKSCRDLDITKVSRSTRGEIVFNNTMSDEEREYIRSLYRGEIAYTDEQVGRLLRELKKLKLTDNLLVIISADHGESLGEHDFYFEHGAYTYDVNIKIPCLVRFPSKHPYSQYAGKRIKGQKVNTDILPTILEFLDLPLPENLDGMSLIPSIVGEEINPRLAFGESGKQYFVNNPKRYLPGIKGKWYFVRDENRKLICIPNKDNGIWEFYNLESDPKETKNIYDPQEPEIKLLQNELKKWMAMATTVSPPRELEYTPAIRKKLRMLGYME